MIDRYSLPRMKEIWTDKSKFDAFLQVEIASTEAFNKAGIVPDIDFNKIKNNATYDLDRVFELEEETKHDVIAFTRAVSETLGEERKWIHYGLTSTDVVDSVNAILLKKCNKILEKDIDDLLNTLKNLAIKYENTPCIGRTHGKHAEITSFGLKFALYYDELLRDKKRFIEARNDIECIKLSGAVGNYLTTTIDIEKTVAEILDLNRAKISTQVLSRDRHAYYISTLALIASCLEKMATEIRNLSREEISEVSEGFAKGQKGSSAMPHKRNPISCENICGCARIMKSYVSVALENNVLWHERDISHSSAERIMLADSTILLDYMLVRFTKTLQNLDIFEENMIKNIYLTNGVIFSGRLLNYLVKKGYTREEAYDLIQPITFKCRKENIDFKDELIKENIISEEESLEIFDLNFYLKSVEAIYKEVGIKE